MTDWAILEALESVIRARRSADPSDSYVAKLFHKGQKKIAEKLGEEAVELVIAALTEDDDATTGEAADLLFHMMIVLEARGLSLAHVVARLGERQGLSGIAEKAARADN